MFARTTPISPSKLTDRSLVLGNPTNPNIYNTVILVLLCYPICPTHRSTAGQRPPTAFPASETPCHLWSTPLPDPVSAWSAALRAALAPASVRRSMARPPPSDGATGACDEHYLEPSGQPLAPHSSVRRATTVQCSSSSTVSCDRHAPRHWPGPQYMPRSASVVGLAKRGVIPRNNSTSECLFLTQ